MNRFKVMRGVRDETGGVVFQLMVEVNSLSEISKITSNMVRVGAPLTVTAVDEEYESEVRMSLSNMILYFYYYICRPRWEF